MVRRTAIDDVTNTTIALSPDDKFSSQASPGSGSTTHRGDDLLRDGHASETTPQEWGRTCVDEEIQVTQQASSIDRLLQEWADAPSAALDHNDPFRDDWICGDTWPEVPCFEGYAHPF
jgi:hypothetical protein